MTADGASSTTTAPHLSSVIVAATIGNALEWFDFLVYGFFASTLAQVFFPARNPTVSLLITFGAFGLSYVVRPLGAAVIGTYTDRAGRKAGLTLSIALMMIGTALMVVTPGYATIGIAAPIIITLARLFQGFSVGGEFGSAVAFLVEHAGDRKGYSASWQWSSTGIVSVIVAIFGLILTTTLTHQQLLDWGWRIPYMFGLLVGPVGLYIRSRMAETPEFIEAVKPPTVPISDLLQRHPVAVLLALGASIISNSSYYLLLYIPTYAVRTLHLPAYTGFAATLVGGIGACDGVRGGGTLVRPDGADAHSDGHGVFVSDRGLSDVLADGGLSVACHGDVCGGFAQCDQGRIQRGAAVAVGRAIPG